MDESGWGRFDILNYDINVKENTNIDLCLLLDHAKEFKHDYLDVNITFYTPSGSIMSRDYHFELKNDDKKWKGDEENENVSLILPIRDQLKINKTGLLKVRIENKMTKITTEGIDRIGLEASISK